MKIKANMDFNLEKEEILVPKGTIILVDDVEETTYNENGMIVVNEERAKEILNAKFKNKSLAKEVKEK